MTSTATPDMGGHDVRALLTELGGRMAADGVHAEMFVVGGAAMALVYDDRRTTADIDAILRPRDVVLDMAAAMARQMGLPTSWLNDAVVEMVPPNRDDNPRTVGEFGGLSVSVASPQYLLAMKAMVSRKSPSDLEDAALLCVTLGITAEAQVERAVRRYFGPGALGSQELWFEDIVERAALLAKERAREQQDRR
ncbi:MAG: DUF6036 family nucleotidyltransferase [Micrococcales bacterium]|nr:DUF6036 family nucleotidyltransferase [Micrococcales bacterium]